MTTYDPFLVSLGWNEFFQASFDQLQEPDIHPARIIGQGRGHYTIQFAHGNIIDAEITTKLHDDSKLTDDFPAVGDWIAFAHGHGSKKASIHAVLDRKSTLQRKRAGNKKTQNLVTNVETLFIVTSMTEDFDLLRLGRYLDIGKDSGAVCAFILTKADLCDRPEHFVGELEKNFPGIAVIAISSSETASMDILKPYFLPGMTSVLLGSSGVGKSTLTNYLQGAGTQKTGGLSGERGRHTTTARNIIFTRWGGLVIDTPGMQEVLAHESTEDLGSSYPEIEALMLQCKFTNCRHQNDPGCAVTAALKNGSLDADSWARYQKALSKKAVIKKKWEK
ncbi:MAG: ribosome small subunit-dependent GTPase A [Bdellovibrionaceae bacterium]|nr:ribosome small subunit-dependent GTPase A [Pseudobdellovibrionaceae bacterium]